MLLEQFYSNNKAKQTLVNWITDGRLPHTVLLEGEDGCGKMTFARMTAAAVLCQQEQSGQRPCGECRNCRLILSDSHPDVIIAQSEDKANSFHVEEIRQIRSDAYVRPNDGDYKVYILRNIHNMTEQAQNALLKIIEEPPKQVIFILTCNNRARVLPTILSRAALVQLSVCTKEECSKALEHLCGKSVTEERRQQAAELSEGNIGKALKMLQDENTLKLVCDARRIAEMVCVGQEFDLLAALQEYTGVKKRGEFVQLLDAMKDYFLDFIRMKNGIGEPCGNISTPVKNRLTALQAMRILAIIDTTTAQVVQNVSPAMAAAAFCAGTRSILQ